MPRTKAQFGAIREATRVKISEAGLKLFARKGLAATSIQDIAAAAGISSGLMYHYYTSKEDLFNELVETAIVSANAEIQALFGREELTAAQKIRTLSSEIAADLQTEGITNYYFILMIHAALGENIPVKTSELRQQGFAPFDLVAGVIAQGQKTGEVRPGDPYQMALAYFALVQGLAIYRLTIGDRFVAPHPDVLNALLLTSFETGFGEQ